MFLYGYLKIMDNTKTVELQVTNLFEELDDTDLASVSGGNTADYYEALGNSIGDYFSAYGQSIGDYFSAKYSSNS
jgi:bacteriocin-like protein